MNAEDLIETIQASGVTSSDEIKDILEDVYIMSLIFELPDFDPDDSDSVAQHAEAQAIVEEAYSLIKAGILHPIRDIELGDFELYWEEVASRGEQEQIDYENMEDNSQEN